MVFNYVISICIGIFLVFANTSYSLKCKTEANTKCLSICNSSDIATRVKAIIVDKLGVDESIVTPEANFFTDLGADYLDFIEIIMEFEKEFNIGIPDDQADSIKTVKDAIKCIEITTCEFEKKVYLKQKPDKSDSIN